MPLFCTEVGIGLLVVGDVGVYVRVRYRDKLNVKGFIKTSRPATLYHLKTVL